MPRPQQITRARRWRCVGRVPATGEHRRLCDRFQRRPLCIKPYLEARRVRSSVGHKVELQRNDCTAPSEWGRYVNPKGDEAGGRSGSESQVPRSTRFSGQHDAKRAETNLCAPAHRLTLAKHWLCFSSLACGRVGTPSLPLASACSKAVMPGALARAVPGHCWARSV